MYFIGACIRFVGDHFMIWLDSHSYVQGFCDVCFWHGVYKFFYHFNNI